MDWDTARDLGDEPFGGVFSGGGGGSLSLFSGVRAPFHLAIDPATFPLGDLGGVRGSATISTPSPSPLSIMCGEDDDEAERAWNVLAASADDRALSMLPRIFPWLLYDAPGERDGALVVQESLIFGDLGLPSPVFAPGLALHRGGD